MPPISDFSEQELLRAVVMGSPSALLVVQADRQVILWNPAAERLFGWAASDVGGREIPIPDDGAREESSRLFSGAFQGQDLVGIQVRRRHRDGHPLDVALSTVALHDTAGKVVAVLGAFEDVTARKAAEAELARQAREAEQYLPPTTTAVIHGPHGKVTLTVPTPMTASGFKPEVSAQTAREAFARRAVAAFKAPSALDHRAARTPRAARSR